METTNYGLGFGETSGQLLASNGHLLTPRRLSSALRPSRVHVSATIRSSYALNPKGPCSHIAHTWALEQLNGKVFVPSVYTTQLHGPFG